MTTLRRPEKTNIVLDLKVRTLVYYYGDLLVRYDSKHDKKGISNPIWPKIILSRLWSTQLEAFSKCMDITSTWQLSLKELIMWKSKLYD